MNYIKQLNAFYDWLEQNTLSTSAFALYFALLMANNKCGWTEWFARTNQALCALTGVSENTLKKARNELKQKGLIDFKPGKKKNDITKYRIIPLYSVSNIDTETDTNKCLVSKIDGQVDTQVDTQTDTQIDTQIDTKELANADAPRPLEELNYKLKTKTETKTKTDINNISVSNETVSSDNDTPPQEHQRQKENIPYQRIAEMYNSICLSLPKVEKITDKRRKHIRKAWNEFKGDISKFEEVFRRAEKSDFLSGRNGKWMGCNFDWLITYNNMVKVLEGTYDNKDERGGLDNGTNKQHTREIKKVFDRSKFLWAGGKGI